MNDDPNVREKRIQCDAESYSQVCILRDANTNEMVWDENTKMWRSYFTLPRRLDEARYLDNDLGLFLSDVRR